MTSRIKSTTDVPVATVTYDDTRESKNDIILPYLVAASGQSRQYIGSAGSRNLD